MCPIAGEHSRTEIPIIADIVQSPNRIVPVGCVIEQEDLTTAWHDGDVAAAARIFQVAAIIDGAALERYGAEERRLPVIAPIGATDGGMPRQSPIDRYFDTANDAPDVH